MTLLTSKPKMVKTLLLVMAVVLALGVNVFSQTTKGNEIAPEVPKSATVEIILSDAPGINDEGSRWEIRGALFLCSRSS